MAYQETEFIFEDTGWVGWRGLIGSSLEGLGGHQSCIILEADIRAGDLADRGGEGVAHLWRAGIADVYSGVGLRAFI